MTSPVRIATAEDEPEIIRLLHLMHEEGGLLSLDVDAARDMFAFAFKKKGGIIGVIGEPGKLVAAMGLLITRFWYTRENHIEEYFNFVDPAHRQSSHAPALIKFAMNCSKEIKIPLVIGVLTNKHVIEKVRLYRWRLGPPAGAFFVFNSKWSALGPPTAEDFKEAVETRSETRRRMRREKFQEKQIELNGKA